VEGVEREIRRQRDVRIVRETLDGVTEDDQDDAGVSGVVPERDALARLLDGSGGGVRRGGSVAVHPLRLLGE